MSLSNYLTFVRQQYDEVEKSVPLTVEPISPIKTPGPPPAGSKLTLRLSHKSKTLRGAIESLPIQLIEDRIPYSSSFTGGGLFKRGSDTCVFKPFIPSQDASKNPPVGAPYVSRVVPLQTDEIKADYYLKIIAKNNPSLLSTLNLPFSISKGITGVDANDLKRCGYIRDITACYNLITKEQGSTFYDSFDDSDSFKNNVIRLYQTQLIPTCVTLNENGLIHDDLHYGNVAFWDNKMSNALIFDFGRAHYKYKEFVNYILSDSTDAYQDRFLLNKLPYPFDNAQLNMKRDPQFMMESLIRLYDTFYLVDRYVKTFEEDSGLAFFKRQDQAMKILSDGLIQRRSIGDPSKRDYKSLAVNFFTALVTDAPLVEKPPSVKRISASPTINPQFDEPQDTPTKRSRITPSDVQQ